MKDPLSEITNGDDRTWTNGERKDWLKRMRAFGHKVRRFKCSDDNCPTHGKKNEERPDDYECGGWHIVPKGMPDAVVRIGEAAY